MVVLTLCFQGPSTSAAEQESVINSLKSWVKIHKDKDLPNSLGEAEWAHASISKVESIEAQEILWDYFVSSQKAKSEENYNLRRVRLGDKTMKYGMKIFGEKPKDGRSLFISMHGGGQAPPSVNDRQWRNQIGLYQPAEGVYVAPRAPTDTWNLWHQSHIDPLFRQLILDLVITLEVNPDKVYINGYSAGGDGVFQLAPRMADTFAASAMMAGHPNETKPDGLRNLPFALYMGGLDRAYNRNNEALKWKGLLEELQKQDPKGYAHRVQIYPENGHWMQLKDKEAFPWMQKFHRNSRPNKIVWLQDDVTHEDFYWLGVPDGQAKQRTRVVAEIKDQIIHVETQDLGNLIIHLDDQLIDLEKPVTIIANNKPVTKEVSVKRDIATIYNNLLSRKDKAYLFPAKISIKTGL